MRLRLKWKETIKRNHIGGERENLNRTSPSVRNEINEGKNARKKYDRNKKQKAFKHKCLNPDCGEYHLLKHGASTSEEKKKQLLEELYKKKELKTVRMDSNSIETGTMPDEMKEDTRCS